MRRLLLAVALLVGGGIMFAAVTPAQALPANTMSEMTKAAPLSNVIQTRWHHHHHYYYYPHHHYYHRYYYRHYYYRRCWWHHGYYRCYWN